MLLSIKAYADHEVDAFGHDALLGKLSYALLKIVRQLRCFLARPMVVGDLGFLNDDAATAVAYA